MSQNPKTSTKNSNKSEFEPGVIESEIIDAEAVKSEFIGSEIGLRWSQKLLRHKLSQKSKTQKLK